MHLLSDKKYFVIRAIKLPYNIEFILKRKIIDRNLTNLWYRFVDKGGFPLIKLQTVKESLSIRLKYQY